MEGISHAATPDLKRVAIAVGIGNFMEWFDWGLYGFFAVVIGKQMFPNNTPAAQILATLGIFAVGFVLRPLGGIVLGPIGDKLGRKVALSISLLLMGVSTALLGLLPSYAEIGIWAPILLLLIRCIQGFSTGGEVTGANAFLVQMVAGNQRAGFDARQFTRRGLTSNTDRDTLPSLGAALMQTDYLLICAEAKSVTEAANCRDALQRLTAKTQKIGLLDVWVNVLV